mmetsp:Transcript_121267/g.223106  ORF Transcript_121267/g.223106 Transcript_121267/m.223106 type:complete len:238 (+) Transcript_121267:112-825(+)
MMEREDSMEVSNDPRFFTDNVLNYRLAAFGGIGVISALFVGNSMDQVWGMNKNMQIFTDDYKTFRPDGLVQLICFCMLIIILAMNMLATYVGVVQPYHTIRLMTSGPTGFEAAASYYLNKNITSYRHLAIKASMNSMWMYTLQMALRIYVKFTRETQETVMVDVERHSQPFESEIEGWVFNVVLCGLGLMILFLHCKHSSVFAERYAMLRPDRELTTFMKGLGVGASARKGGWALDV